MISDKNRDVSKVVSLSALGLFCVVYAINAYYSYSATMVGDIHLYLSFTKALLHGSFSIPNPLASLLSGHFSGGYASFTTGIPLDNGTLVSAVTVGTHLLLAPFVWLFDDNVFWIAPVFYDLVLILSLFMFTRAYFAKRIPASDSLAWYAALAVTALYGILVNFRLNLRRDTLCAALLCLLTALLFQAMQTNKKRFWHTSLALISLLTITKIYFAFLYIPFLAILVTVIRKQPVRLKDGAIQCTIAFLINLVLYIPFFLQNHAGTGHWFCLTQQAAFGQLYMPQSVPLTIGAMAANTLELIKVQAVFFIPDGIPVLGAAITILLLLAGVWAERKNAFVMFWLLPCWLFLYGFFIVWHQSHPGEDFAYNIYLSPTYPISMFFVICGIVFIVQRYLKKKWILPAIAVIALLPFLLVKTYRIMPSHRHVRFQLPQAVQLRSDILGIMPEGSILLCDKFLSLSIDYFAGVHSFPPSRLGGSAAEIARGIACLIDSNKTVFIADYLGIEGSYVYVDSLRDYFDLQLVKEKQPLLNFPAEGGGGYMAIYEIRRK